MHCQSPAQLFRPNLHLSDAINRNIIQSEVEGGVYLHDLMPGDRLEIETHDWICALVYRGGSVASICGHPVLCPHPVEVHVSGSTWGGSVIKQHFIGRGMHLEVHHPVHRRIVTSRIVEIRAM